MSKGRTMWFMPPITVRTSSTDLIWTLVMYSFVVVHTAGASDSLVANTKVRVQSVSHDLTELLVREWQARVPEFW